MKKLFSLCAFALTLTALCTPFTGCSDVGFSTESHTFYKMNTQANLVISDKFDSEKLEKFEKLCLKTDRLLEEIECSLTISKMQTEGAVNGVYAFNCASAGEKVEIGERAYTVLQTALRLCDFTDGSYNPAVYYSTEVCGFYSSFSEHKLPDTAEAEAFKVLAESFTSTRLIEEDGKYFAVKPDKTVEVNGENLTVKIDLGGIGKGYATDEVKKLISSYGFEYGYFSFGTSSITCLSHYENGDYSLGITNPRPESYGETFAKTVMRNENVSSSGDYENYFEKDGVRYCHVIDPITALPVRKGIMCATVIGGLSAENDALTTAIMAMDVEDAKRFIEEKLTDRRALFAYEEGGNYYVYANFDLEITNGKFVRV